ncbi:hypothetical protein MRB53_022857 [Persea americana]|uniref:Uncharacterized protein n=1 Tax=Persea americana TaxID=3435 RepID=A0ACC2L912_PERAE|nr:hypothetical protein MRB53_022857 [Persea americana]
MSWQLAITFGATVSSKCKTHGLGSLGLLHSYTGDIALTMGLLGPDVAQDYPFSAIGAFPGHQFGAIIIGQHENRPEVPFMARMNLMETNRLLSVMSFTS